MPQMRAQKQKLKKYLESPDWHGYLDEIANAEMSSVGPLFSFLLLEPELMHRSACALGKTVARIAEKNPESARNIIRRFIWHLSEESGNIGWGIPEAFAESLGENPSLAQEYHKILISYIMDLGHEDNYCDNDLLRRSCYWAVGRLAQSQPRLCLKARDWLRKGLADKDEICQGMAAWALAQLPPNSGDALALFHLAQSDNSAQCAIFNGKSMESWPVNKIAHKALEISESARLKAPPQAKSCHDG